MTEERSKHPFIQCLALFAFIYIGLLVLAGLLKNFSSVNISGASIFIGASIFTSYRLAQKVHRYLTKAEIFMFSLGAFVVVAAIDLTAVFFLQKPPLPLMKPPLQAVFWGILLMEFLGLLFQFWYLPNRVFKQIEAAEKNAKAYDKADTYNYKSGDLRSSFY